MAVTEIKFDNNTLTVSISGRIDSANAALVEEKFFKILSKRKKCSVEIDCSKLEYISSAGLRILLKIRKEYDVRIFNVSSEIYEILDMTGFTEMMKVEKKFKELSVEGCEIIGQGSNGVVYRLNPEIIIKVYRNPDSIVEIKRERDLARYAFVKGIPTAISYEIAKVGNLYGSVFELLNAKSLSKLLIERPDMTDYYVDIFTNLLKKIHSIKSDEGKLDNMKIRVISWLTDIKNELNTKIFGKLSSLIDSVPSTLNIIHGDYHTNNVLMQNEEPVLIDMDTICSGDPVFEFASIFLAFKGFSVIDRKTVTRFLGFDYNFSSLFFQKVLEKYFGTTDKEYLKDCENKSMLIAYLRLLRRTLRREPGNTALITVCKNNVENLTSVLNNLSF